MNNMKKILSLVSMVCLCGGFAACDKHSGYTYYSGKEYIMFAETAHQYPVEQEGTFFVDVASTVACDYDRTVAVEVVGAGSSAIEGRHFDLKERNVVIKAGERTTRVEIVGHYDAFQPSDSLGTRLRLVIPESQQWELYPDNLETTVSFFKFCPYIGEEWLANEMRESDPEKYDYANYIFYASFPYHQGGMQFDKFLVKVKRDASRPDRLIVIDPFATGRNMKVDLHPGGAGENFVTVPAQEGFFTSNMGWINIASTGKENFYNSCERFIFITLNCYVDQVGSLGTYPYMLEWISERKAQELRNQGM